MIAYSEEFLSNFIGSVLTPPLWMQIIEFLFTVAKPTSVEVAKLARLFYDSERARVLPEAPRHDIFLADMSFDVFSRDMQGIENVRVGEMITKDTIDKINLRMARSVENTGRWTIMKAVETPDPWFEAADDESWMPEEGFSSRTLSREELRNLRKDLNRRKNGVQGWARVPTGNETCAFCLVMCSRGAVYRDAKSAGSRVDSEEALRLQRAGLFTPEDHMTQWHTGCDCKVVPVWDLDDWPGMERADALYRMWSKATKNTYGKESMRAFRRMIESGEDFNDYIE